MDGLTDRGAERLLGAWSGQLPAPELFVELVGWVPGAVRQRVRLDGFGGVMGGRVTFGRAPPSGWRISAIAIVDEYGEPQARLPLDEQIIIEPNGTFEYELTTKVVGEDRLGG